MKKGKLVWLMLLTICCVGNVFAQSDKKNVISPKKIEINKGNRFPRKSDFIGKNITLKLEKADLRELLNFITDKFGYNFVIDTDVKTEPITVEIKDVPWDIALESVLSYLRLGIQVNGAILRVAKVESLQWSRNCYPNEKNLDNESLYTEFIKLKRLEAGSYPGPCGFGGCSPDELKKQPTGLSKIIAKLLSRRGAIETDNRSNSIIITDTRARLDEIVKRVKEWDKSNLTVEEIIKDFESKNSEN